MLASIHPLGERARQQRWSVTVTAHIAGAVVGGAVATAAAGLLGWALAGGATASAAVPWLGAAVCLACLVLDAGALPWSLPTLRRQVNEDWLARYRGWVYGGGFGFQLGLAVATVVTTATVYAALVLALLTRSPVQGALMGATFGLVRSSALLTVAKVDRPELLWRVHRRWQRLAAPSRVCGLAATGLVATALLVAGARG